MSIISSFVSKRRAQNAVKPGFHYAWISVFLNSVHVFVSPTRPSIRNNIKSSSNVCFCASCSFSVLYIKVEHKLACWFILSTPNSKLEGWREGGGGACYRYQFLYRMLSSCCMLAVYNGVTGWATETGGFLQHGGEDWANVICSAGLLHCTQCMMC